jgi:TonB family protein
MANAQDISFNYFYKLDMSDANEPPQIGGIDVDFPETARKNGVEGTLKAVFTLGENGKVRDIVVGQPLPHGVTEAVTQSLRNLHFKPAKRNGTPVPVTMIFDFVVTAMYKDDDKNVSKAKILDQAAAVYPSEHRAEKTKGKVSVTVIFFPDGKIKVLGASSVMPREFDKAALAAAENIKFQPAVHKKSKKPVAQQMTVEYDFKP